VAALAKLKINTVVGTVDWTSGPVPNVAKTPLTGGQWRSVSVKVVTPAEYESYIQALVAEEKAAKA